MLVKTSASWSAHALITRPGMQSGLAALHVLTLLTESLTTEVDRVSIRSSGGERVLMAGSLLSLSKRV